jgi:hypothetical protein
MTVRQKMEKMKLFGLGLLLGACVAFPLGLNYGRKAPLLSNPISHVNVQEKVAQRVRTSTDPVLAGAREKIHEATGPASDTD